ncbi:MAG: hypothetical protein LC689_08475 [Myxococcales bacterium]|nr:hypothetical protein [Myxococcales bacterium]
MRSAIAVLVVGGGVAVACWGTTRLRNGTESVEAQLLRAWPDTRRIAPGRNKDSDIVFEELVIRAHPAPRTPKVRAFRTEPVGTASR